MYTKDSQDNVKTHVELANGTTVRRFSNSIHLLARYPSYSRGSKDKKYWNLKYRMTISFDCIDWVGEIPQGIMESQQIP